MHGDKERRPRRVGIVRAAPWLLAGLAICLVMAHTVGWFWAEQTLRREVAGWIAAQRAQGLALATGPARSAGWPFAVRLELPDVVAGPGGLPGGGVLRTARASVGVSLLQPGLLRIVLPQPLRLTLPDEPDIAASAADWHVDMPLQQPDRAAMDAQDWRADWTPAGQAPQTLSAALLHLLVTPDALDTRLTLSAQAIDLPAPRDGQILPLGRRLASVSGDATLHGPLPDTTSAAALAGWRELGGRLDISRGAFGYGPLGVLGSGSVTLDAALQPAATAQLHVLGAAATLDALAQARALDPNAATAAKAVLALLTRIPEDGGAPAVDLPLRLRDRVLSLAGYPLMTLPPIVWPQTK